MVTGFIDGCRQANIQVYIDRYYLRLMFRVRLHIDDIGVLHKIRAFLGVGRVVNNENPSGVVYLLLAMLMIF